MSTLILLLAAASVCDCGLTCRTTLTFVSFAPRVVARVRALFGLRVVLGEPGGTFAAVSASEAVLLGLRLCAAFALPGLEDGALPRVVLLAKSGPKAKVWCFCAPLGVDIPTYSALGVSPQLPAQQKPMHGRSRSWRFLLSTHQHCGSPVSSLKGCGTAFCSSQRHLAYTQGNVRTCWRQVTAL